MEPCGADDNQVFTKTNPWIAAILALAAEIYHLDKLKLNLKFEIEMVFRNLGLQVRSHWQLQQHTACAADDCQAAVQ